MHQVCLELSARWGRLGSRRGICQPPAPRFPAAPARRAHVGGSFLGPLSCGINGVRPEGRAQADRPRLHRGDVQTPGAQALPRAPEEAALPGDWPAPVPSDRTPA